MRRICALAIKVKELEKECGRVQGAIAPAKRELAELREDAAVHTKPHPTTKLQTYQNQQNLNIRNNTHDKHCKFLLK